MGKRKITFMLVVLLCSLFCGCQKKETEKEPEKLDFFASGFYEKEGFCFDGLELLDSYEYFEKRLELTEEEPVVQESESYGGKMKVISFYQVTAEGVPNARGDVEYSFFQDNFLGGRMQIMFSDYADAVEYVKERRAELAKYQSKDAKEQMEKEGAAYKGYTIYESESDSSVSFCYVDDRDFCISFLTSPSVDGMGEVKVFLSENIDYNRPGGQGYRSAAVPDQRKV